MTEAEESITRRDSLVRALRTLNAMEAKLQRLQDAQTEPIAIIGMGCRFPGGANDPNSFWELMDRGENTAGSVPSDRWNIDDYYDPDPNAPGKTYTRFGNFIINPSPTQFDPHFFNISPQEALSLDPQQRLLLEVTWEALEYGGIAADTLYNSDTGVFIGMSTYDYQFIAFKDAPGTDPYRSSGSSGSVASGRISYFLGLHGPTYTVDSACSSALVALHQACRSLRGRECNLAIVGGTNMVISPYSTIAFSKMGMLSPDGKCKAFSADADGYGRGEGCGVILVKRLSDAVEDHDRILAVIRGSAVNHVGRSGGISGPNSISQQKVVRTAMAQCNISPNDIDYIEAHGTGTPLGDAIELGALAEVFGGRSSGNPLRIGSVKTNIGHLESASGMAAIIKTVLALNHERLPQHLNLGELNPIIPWDELAIRVTAEPEKWPIGENPRLAGVNSFGFSGTNVHVILEGGEKFNTPRQETTTTDSYHILTLSAKSEQALQDQCQRYAVYLQDNQNIRLADMAYTVNTGRVHFRKRIAIVTKDRSNTLTALKTFTEGNNKNGILGISSSIFRGTADTNPQVGFIFTGQMSQNEIGAIATFYHASAEYRNIIEKYDQIVLKCTGHTIQDLLGLVKYSQSEKETTLKRNDQHQALSQALLYLSEVACAKLFINLGVKPAMVMGMHLGLITAAHIAGVLEFEDGFRLVMHLHKVNTDTVDNPLPELQLHSPNLPIINPVTGIIIDKKLLKPSFWTQNTHKPVQLNSALHTMMKHGIFTFLALGSNAKERHLTLPEETNTETLWLSFWLTQEESKRHVLEVLSKLYVQGVQIDWDAYYQLSQNEHLKLHLPTYPFQRQTYWFDAVEQTRLTTSPTQLSLFQEPAKQRILPALPHFDPHAFMLAPVAGQKNQIKDIMRQTLAHLLDCEAESVDFNLSYTELGISSIQILQLMILLQDHLAIPIKIDDLYQGTDINESVTNLITTILKHGQNIPGTNNFAQSGDHKFLKDLSLNIAHSESDPTSSAITYQPRYGTPDYVFLLSCPRAGSTLLRVMLDKHPNLYAPPELNLLLYNTMSEYVNILSPIGWVDNLLRSIMRVKDVNLPQAEELINIWSNDNKPTIEIYRELSSGACKTLVDKSPIYAYDLPTMQKILSFKKVKVIFLSRHPYSAIVSMIRSQLVAKYVVALGLGQKWDEYKQAEQQWSMLNRNILDFCESLDSADWIHVRYEDLVTIPNQEMRRLCNFLKVPFDKSVLHPYEGDHDTTALPEHKATGGDPNFNQYVEIDDSKGEEWRYMKLPHQLGGLARFVSGELGYTLPQEQSSGYPIRKKTPLLVQGAGQQRRIHNAIHVRHQKYDHPKKSLTGVLVRLLRRILRKVGSTISYERGLHILNLVAQSRLLQSLTRKHMRPAWQVLEIINREPITNSLKNTWTANYFNFMVDWVQLKRLTFIKNPDTFTADGLENLENTLAMNKGVILVGHHCQPLRLWDDFVRYNVKAAGISQLQAIGGLRRQIPNPTLLENGHSKSAQDILIRQLQNCITVLNNGGLIYIDADGPHGSHPPIMIQCLGRQMHFMTGFAEIALQTDAPVVQLTANYTTLGHVHLQYHPALSVPSATLSHGERIRGLVMQYATQLEAQWQKYPENIPLHICRNILVSDNKNRKNL